MEPTSSRLKAALQRHFGYDRFRPLQEEIITRLLERQDVVALMPTGGGKSLCYQLPALLNGGLTLVVSPLISLMQDQVDALTADGVAAAYLNSTLKPAAILAVQQRAASGQLKILYLAPERLVTAGFRDWLRRLPCSLVAIDEAHCISEWGHDFRPDYRNLKILRQEFPAVPTIALTATATPRVRQDIIQQLALRQPAVFCASVNRPNLAYAVWPRRQAIDPLLELIRQHRGESAIIYCFSRADTEQIAARLNDQGFAALPYHAGLAGAVRAQTQSSFIRDDVPIIVATIAFGMGIDKPDVRLIVHYHLPKSVEGYYQETGRAGRDGLPSQCVLLFSAGDRRKHGYFIDQMQDPKQRQVAWDKLEQMVGYGRLTTCRRRYLLEHFGERYEAASCNACDRCREPAATFDATVVAQKVLSAVLRTGERFGPTHIIRVLRGLGGERMAHLGHDRLSVYGIIRDFGRAQLQAIIDGLADAGMLGWTTGEYPGLVVTPKGRAWLQRRDQVFLPDVRRVGQAAAVISREPTSFDQTLYEALRQLRKTLADKLRVPPYIIFGNATLRAMAAAVPQTLPALRQISGVGDYKLGQFGQEFLEVIQEHVHGRGTTLVSRL